LAKREEKKIKKKKTETKQERKERLKKRRIEETKKRLYTLYVIQVEYNKLNKGEKRKIRKEYEQRFKRNFYYDRKMFKRKGNPVKWEIEKTYYRYKVRYVTKKKIEEIEKKHIKDLRKKVKNITKTYETDALFRFVSWQETNIPVMKIINGETYIYDYEEELEMLIKKVKKRIKKIDRTYRNGVRVKKGFRTFYTFLDRYRAIIFLMINNYTRIISTTYTTYKQLEIVVKYTLRNFLKEVISYNKTGNKSFENKYDLQEGEGDKVREIRIVRVEVHKRTNYNMSYELLPQNVMIEKLESMKLTKESFRDII